MTPGPRIRERRLDRAAIAPHATIFLMIPVHIVAHPHEYVIASGLKGRPGSIHT